MKHPFPAMVDPASVVELVETITSLPRRVVHHYAVESVLGSRRNAMIASTALAQRRAETDAVDEFLARLGVQEVAAAAAHG